MVEAKVHGFKEYLALESKYRPAFDEIYYQVFPDLESIETITKLSLQKEGVDRIIHLPNGKRAVVDEKIRMKDYGDILLEYLSNDKTGAPGWVIKPGMRTTILAYAIATSKTCYLIPFKKLQQVFKKNGEGWKSKYKIAYAKNKGYTTESVAVPMKVLKQAGVNISVYKWTVNI